MTRIWIAALTLCTLAACGGKSGTLSLNIVVSPTDDPFASAATVRFTVGDSTHVTTVPVTAGHFTYKISQKPESMAGTVLVEALDAAGAVVAHGVTPALDLSAMDQGPIGVWVGRPGTVATTTASLTAPQLQADGTSTDVAFPRTDMASTMVPGLGVLFAGGRDSAGNALRASVIYDVYLQQIIEITDMEVQRAGGVAGASDGVHAWAYGGASALGLGAIGAPQATIELFDPSTGLGTWNNLASDAFTARSYPSGVLLASGDTLVSGGIDGNGMLLNSAALVNPSGAVRLTALATPMAAARSGHAAAAAHFNEGDGAILFGGLPVGSTDAVAERLVGQTFSAYDVGAQPNLVGATATTLPSGAVLVLGGQADDGSVSAGGILITPATVANTPPTVTPQPMAMSAPRVGHTATISGSDLVVCGGAAADGTLQASCDIFDTKSQVIKRTVPLATARRNHSAQALETGDIVIAGGLGADGKPLASIEIFTHE